MTPRISFKNTVHHLQSSTWQSSSTISVTVLNPPQHQDHFSKIQFTGIVIISRPHKYWWFPLRPPAAPFLRNTALQKRRGFSSGKEHAAGEFRMKSSQVPSFTLYIWLKEFPLKREIFKETTRMHALCDQQRHFNVVNHSGLNLLTFSLSVRTGNT